VFPQQGIYLHCTSKFNYNRFLVIERNHSICAERTGAINQLRIITCAVPFYLAKAAARHPSSRILRMLLRSGTSLAPFIAVQLVPLLTLCFVFKTAEVSYCLDFKEAGCGRMRANN
jgi:hypothetical protein